jgi:hypothetical protein
MLDITLYFLTPLCIALLICLPIEYLLSSPKVSLRARSLTSWAGHISILIWIFAVELLVFQRPWFAASQVVFLFTLMMVINRVKITSLHEPFLYQDFSYFIDILRYPRLYLPYFGLVKIVLILMLVLALIVSAFLFWQSAVDITGTAYFVGAVGALMMVAYLLMMVAKNANELMVFEPVNDIKNMGLLMSFICYYNAEKKHSLNINENVFKYTHASTPHIVVVQSESFFDARKLCSDVGDTAYRWFDKIRCEATQFGVLDVPAFGANTVRTEFSFLSGLHNSVLGVHQFNPFKSYLKESYSTLAESLQSAGYKTICIHPYSSDFYNRASVYPQMGFDEFIDINAFSDTDYFGQFISDVAVARVVNERLLQADGPLFIFVITMENHGPLHLETMKEEDAARFYHQSPSYNPNDMTVYLRHIENAGLMAESICNTLKSLDCAGWLCWYGDHMPIMPKVYQQKPINEKATEYFIWSSMGSEKPVEIALSVEELALQLLENISNKNSSA